MFLKSVRDRVHFTGTESFYYFLSITAICMAGILLRISLYLYHRSFWLDEACLVMNILNRTFVNLLKPLDYNQAAPLGFLLSTKVLVKLFGMSEYVFRMIPLLSGIATIILFLAVGRKLLGRKILLLALFLLSFSPTLIYYSTEFKQYGSDAFICLGLLALALLLLEKKEKIWPKIMLGIAGIIAMVFSFPALFVMAGIGLTLAVSFLKNKDRKNLFSVIMIGFVWLVCIVGLYVFLLHAISKNQILQNYWSTSFAPIPPKSIGDIGWYFSSLLDMFEFSAGISITGVAFFLFILGGVSFFHEKKEVFFFLLTPLLIALLASAFHFYPFSSRHLTFIIPVLLLLIARGTAFLANQLSRKYLWVPALLFALVAVPPAYAVYQRQQNPEKEEINQAIQFIRQNWQPDDTIYVYYASNIAFQYYSRVYQIPRGRYKIGVVSQNWDVIQKDLAQYKGTARFWFLYSHARGNDIDANLFFLRQTGKELQSFLKIDAGVYLFDLSDP